MWSIGETEGRLSSTLSSMVADSHIWLWSTGHAAGPNSYYLKCRTHPAFQRLRMDKKEYKMSHS